MPCTIRIIRLAIANGSFIVIAPGSLPGTDQLPVRSAEDCANDDEDYVQNCERHEKGIRQHSLLREPSAHAAGFAFEKRDQEEDCDFDARNSDTAPECRIADQLLQAEEVPWRLRRVRRMRDVNGFLEGRIEQ